MFRWRGKSFVYVKTEKLKTKDLKIKFVKSLLIILKNFIICFNIYHSHMYLTKEKKILYTNLFTKCAREIIEVAFFADEKHVYSSFQNY